MTDYEYELYAALKAYVVERHPETADNWSTVRQANPAATPAISVEMTDNPVSRKYYDGTDKQYCNPQFVARAYVAEGDKYTAKALLATCDEYLFSIGLLRTYGPAMENDTPNGVLGMYAIYDGNMLAPDGKIYGR